MTEETQGATRAELDSYVFRKSIHMQLILQGLVKATGDLRDKRCLAIGSTNAMFSRQLRASGGAWQELVFDPEVVGGIRVLCGDTEVKIYQKDAPLPFEDKEFDIVILVNGLSEKGAEYEFVKKCHKIIASDGYLVVCVPRQKKLSLIGPLRSLFGFNDERHNERKLFDILKDGFDVIQMRSSSRFFMEVVEIIASGMAKKRQTAGSGEQKKIYTIAYAFYFIAYQLDVLIFFTKGHRLIALAKKHSWRSRRAPVLSDGRTMSEAVLKPLTD